MKRGTRTRLALVLAQGVSLSLLPVGAFAAEEHDAPSPLTEEEADAPAEAPPDNSPGEQEGEETNSDTAILSLSPTAKAAIGRGDCRGLLRELGTRQDPVAILHRVRCGEDSAAQACR